jgi:hypothetical protein
MKSKFKNCNLKKKIQKMNEMFFQKKTKKKRRRLIFGAGERKVRSKV